MSDFADLPVGAKVRVKSSPYEEIPAGTTAAISHRKPEHASGLAGTDGLIWLDLPGDAGDFAFFPAELEKLP